MGEEGEASWDEVEEFWVLVCEVVRESFLFRPRPRLGPGGDPPWEPGEEKQEVSESAFPSPWVLRPSCDRGGERSTFSRSSPGLLSREFSSEEALVAALVLTLMRERGSGRANETAAGSAA